MPPLIYGEWQQSGPSGARDPGRYNGAGSLRVNYTSFLREGVA